jgi:demethylmenaquinone methyltransferase/2-methoxy-6-polyprenyl-1,4-benzoquinol methylase
MDKDNFFNDSAEHWDEISHHNMDKIETLIKLLLVHQGDKVLDVGTGTGVLLPVLSKYTEGKNISAIDSAEKMIEVAKRKFENLGCTFIAGDAENYPFEKNSFDLIICFSVFPHFEDKPKTLRHLSEALSKGGLLAILHSASKEKINGIHVHTSSSDIKMDYLLPAEEIAAFMRKMGLKPELIIDNAELYAVGARK